VITPKNTCRRNSAITVQKNFSVAFIDGVANRPPSGSSAGARDSSPPSPRVEA